jgi:cathepsin L
MDYSGKFGNEGCNEGLVDPTFQYIKVNNGVNTEASYPYEAMEGICRFNRSNVNATDTVSITIICVFHLLFCLFKGFVKLPRGNETALQMVITTVGPIAVAIDSTHPSFHFYASGVYDELKCSCTQLAHTVIVVGYDTFYNGTVKQDYYIVKNSWVTHLE